MNKLKKTSIIFLILAIILSCNHRRTAADFIKLEKRGEVYECTNERFEQKNEKIGDQFWIKLGFINNTYNLNSNNIIAIYVNSKLVYRGAYERFVDLKINQSDFFLEGDDIRMSLEIFTDKTKKNVWLHRFYNKELFGWKKDYKIIYCGFFPTNETVEQIFFFPQLSPIY